MGYSYHQYDPERMARATRRGESISFKQSVELAKKLRGMRSDRAERYLEAVIAKKAAVPFTRFTNGAGHKRGIGPGKYPLKTATAFLQLLKQALANAENKALGSPLQLVNVVANEANGQIRSGRKRGRQSKSTHIEMVLAETDETEKRAKKAPKGVKVKEVLKEAPKEETPAKESDKKDGPAAQKATPAESPASSKPAVPAPSQAHGAKAEKGKKSESVNKDGD